MSVLRKLVRVKLGDYGQTLEWQIPHPMDFAAEFTEPRAAAKKTNVLGRGWARDASAVPKETDPSHHGAKNAHCSG